MKPTPWWVRISLIDHKRIVEKLEADIKTLVEDRHGLALKLDKAIEQRNSLVDQIPRSMIASREGTKRFFDDEIEAVGKPEPEVDAVLGVIEIIKQAKGGI